jgi:hypothetical protein
MRMIMVAAAMMAAMVASPAAAESWRQSASNDNSFMFIDTDSMRRDGAMVRAVTMTVVLPDRAGAFDRVVTTLEINCSALRSVVMEARFFAGSRLIESSSNPWPERPVTRGTIIGDTVQVACGQLDYQSGVVADPYAAAMARLRQPSAPRKSAVVRQ